MKKTVNTKVIATLGPGTKSDERIKDLIHAGAHVFRLNTSHESEEIHKGRIESIRRVAKAEGANTAILLDLQGPKIRVGTLLEPIVLADGQEVIIRPEKEQSDPNILPVDYSGIVQDVKPGDKILLDDGKLTLVVVSKTADTVTAKVIHGGPLSSRKGLNIPGSTKSISAITERDLAFVKFGVEQKVDYFAISFVRDQNDITDLKALIKKFGGDIPVIAKIEKPQAVDNLEAIMDVTDGVMVARGDLGIELSPEEVPLVQKRIVKMANEKRKVVIVATQMLESMISSPIPTRAEASDVANAIFDGTDAIMLSGETAVGAFPIEAVQMMRSISATVEGADIAQKEVKYEYVTDEAERYSQAITTAVTRMACEVDINAIVVFTRTGSTAQLLAKEKPCAPIIAICDDEAVCRRLNLFWGITPLFMPYEDELSKESVKATDEFLQANTALKLDDKVVITGGLPFLGFERTNYLRLHRIGNLTDNK